MTHKVHEKHIKAENSTINKVKIDTYLVCFYFINDKLEKFDTNR